MNKALNAGWWSGTWAIINRLLLVLVMWPAVGLSILVAAFSDWSFSGAGKLLVEMQYEAQQLGKAEQEGRLVVKRCANEAGGSIGIPRPLLCDLKTQELPIADLANRAGEVLAQFYFCFVLISFCLAMVLVPASPLRLRNRIDTALTPYLEKLKSRFNRRS